VRLEQARMASMSDTYLTEPQAAELLGNCTRTLVRWRLLKIGPPATRLGRRILYRRAALEAWLLSKEESK
jgi:hypothetical protein